MEGDVLGEDALQQKLRDSRYRFQRRMQRLIEKVRPPPARWGGREEGKTGLGAGVRRGRGARPAGPGGERGGEGGRSRAWAGREEGSLGVRGGWRRDWGLGISREELMLGRGMWGWGKEGRGGVGVTERGGRVGGWG